MKIRPIEAQVLHINHPVTRTTCSLCRQQSTFYYSCFRLLKWSTVPSTKSIINLANKTGFFYDIINKIGK